MKHCITLLVAVFAAMTFTMCASGGKNADTAQQKENKREMKTLIAYFSATGTTRKQAERMARLSGADLFEIKPETPYTDADLDWRDSASRSSVEMHDPKSRPAFVKSLENLDKYDTVYIGYPVWWYVAPHIVNNFIESYDLKGKRVIPFATSGGSTVEETEEQLKKDYPDLNWSPGLLLNSVSDDRIRQWMDIE